MDSYTYRSFIESPPAYERELADALYEIMGRHVHDPTHIVEELNSSGPNAPDGTPWTVELFKSEIERLGAYTNAVGGPVGRHNRNARSERIDG